MFTSYIFIGQPLRKLASATSLQVRKNAGERADGSFCGFSWIQDAKGVPDVVRYVPAPANPLAFAPDLSDEFEVVPDAVPLSKADDAAVVAFFRQHYQQYVNISGLHSKMYVCIIAAGHKAGDMATAECLARCIDGIRNANFMVDVMTLAPELVRAVADDDAEEAETVMESQNRDTIEALNRLCQARQEIPVVRDVLLIQNTNAQRMALRMNSDTLAEVLAWRAIAMTESTQAAHIRVTDQDSVAAFGIACLSFDRYYFLHYLLHHAYLSVMEREGVQRMQVDVNKVAEVATQCVQGRASVLTGFWEKYVAPQLNGGKDWGQIVPEVRAKMDEFIDELEQAMTSYLPGEDLTLPEKRAVLAQILLSDDDLLSGALFDTKQLTFLDVLKQPMALFVDYNNQGVTFVKDDEGLTMQDPDTGMPVVEHSILSRPLSVNGYIHLPIDDIKAMRIRIREASEYIRRLDEEIQAVRKQQTDAVVAQQVVVGEEFRFDDSRFKAVARTLVEQPLTENYVAEKVTGEKNVDLAYDFTVVKDQAQVGACSAFAVTSVMEYILKKNKCLTSDLSERFVYYNVRDINGRLEEQGAAVSEVINSMAQMGVCTETLCPYSAEHVNDRPSDEAYAEALKHRIIEAKNIPLVADIQHNIDQMRSAIAEGYPVIASFKVFKEMESGLPFVAMPAEGEEGENHAMVICGFDDDTGFFKVRNSWGVAFGEKGYCYMPYAYVGQKKYVNAAYIITQVASTDHVKGVASKHHISFDSTDTAIKIAILSSLRDLKKVQQEQWLETYRKMYADLVHLNGNLKDKSKRDAIVDETRMALKEKKDRQEEQLHRLESEMGDRIEEFRNNTRRTLFYMIIPAFLLLAGILLLTQLQNGWGWANTIMAIVAGIDILAIVGFIVSRERALATLKNNLKMEIEGQARLVSATGEEIRLLEKRAFVAGMLIDSLSKLHDNLSLLNASMKSYVNNLYAWYKEEKESVAEMKVNERPPFISILSNEPLQLFFDSKKQQLTDGIRLWELMRSGNYAIDEQNVIKFKRHLKNVILEHLNQELADFSIYQYWVNPGNYPFLKSDDEAFTKMLKKAVNDYSQVLLPQNNNQGNAGITIMLHHPSDRTAQLKASFKPYTPLNPQCENIPLREALIVLQTQHVDLDNISM